MWDNNNKLHFLPNIRQWCIEPFPLHLVRTESGMERKFIGPGGYRHNVDAQHYPENTTLPHPALEECCTPDGINCIPNFHKGRPLNLNSIDIFLTGNMGCFTREHCSLILTH